MKKRIRQFLALIAVVTLFSACGSGTTTTSNTSDTNIVIDPQAYYIDAQNGNDNNNGKTPDTAWRSLSKINSTTINAGNQILFRSGQQWTGMLEIKNSGTAENPITIGSYGDGNYPVISAVTTLPQTEWIRYQTAQNDGDIASALDPVKDTANTWVAIVLNENPDRVRQNNVEILGAHESMELDNTFPWFYNAIDKNIFYFYGTQAPSNITTNTYPEPIYINSQKYIKIENLELEGGYTAGLFLEETSDITVNNVLVGNMSKRGVYVKNENTTANNIIVDHCSIDSKYTLDYSSAGVLDVDTTDNKTTTSRGASEGIEFLGNVKNSQVSYNSITNWTHANINFSSNSAQELTNNKVFNNVLTSPNIPYGGRIGLDGKNAHHNEFYNNTIKDTSASTQFNGHDNHFHDNTIEGTKNSVLKDFKTGQGLVLQGYEAAVYGNIIENNTFKNTEAEGLKLSAYNTVGKVTNNIIRNNTFINCTLLEEPAVGGDYLPNENNTIENNTFQ